MPENKLPPKLLIVTTVPITLKVILSGQPSFLSSAFDVSIVSSPDEELLYVSSQESVSSFQVPMERGISPLRDLVSVFKMVKLFQTHKPHMVHSYTPKAGLVSMLAGFIARVPIRIHTFTGLIFPTSTGIKKLILIWMDRLICACATNVVPEGNGVKKDLLDHGITNKPLAVIGNGNIAGVDLTRFDKSFVIKDKLHIPLKLKLNMPSNAFVFCFVGRFTLDKGFIELIDAFKLLPDNAHLLLVGENDVRQPLPDEITALLNSHARIYNIGFQIDIRPALALSNVLVLPSYREGFPNTPLQAGAMSLPSIVTDINGCNEIIKPRYNGWIVPVKDSVALYEAMLSATNSDDLLALGENARLNIKQNFERNQHWKNMLSFYQNLLNKNSIK